MEKNKTIYAKKVWTGGPKSPALYLVHTPAIITFVYAFVNYPIMSLLIFVLAFLVAIVSGAVTYHRYYTHDSFRTTTFFHYLIISLATFSGNAPLPMWKLSHKLHHINSDTTKDMHSPSHRGIWTTFFVNWFAWPAMDVTKDIKYRTSKFIKFTTDYYVLLNLTLMILLYFFYWPAFVFYCFHCIITLFFQSSANVLGHHHGHAEDWGAKLSWLLQDVSCHGYHHKKPYSYKNPNGDIATWFIEQIKTT